MERKPPPRGARAGVKADLKASKEDGQAGFAAGQGTTAWTHDFLNKKPWHPLNFRNQMKRFEAEEELIRKQKLEEANKAEFDAEQTYLETLSYLPGKEADKYRDMQGVSWMYIKPPGMKGIEGETTEQQNSEASKAGSQPGAKAPGSKAVPGSQQGVERELPADPEAAAAERRQKERGIGSAIGHRIRFQRRPQSPPIGGLPQGASYDFVTEDEPEVDERLLRALQGAVDGAGPSDRDTRDNNSAGPAAACKRQQESPRGRGSDGNMSYNSGERHTRTHRDERGARRQYGAKSSRYENGDGPDMHERHAMARERHGGRHRRSDRDHFDGDRSRLPSQGDRHAAEGRSHQRSSQRSDHERQESPQRDRRDERRSREGLDTYHAVSGVDGECDRGGRGGSGAEKSGGEERSHKDKKSKKRKREKKGQVGKDTTLEDAVRFIVDQGLSAEEVLNELRGRKK